MTTWQDELEARARAVLPAHVWRYVSAGAREEVSLGESRTTWRDVRLWPRVLHDVRDPRLSVELLGESWPAPIGIAPTSMQRFVHPDGELAMAAGARDADVPLVVSTNAGTRFADLGATGVRWWLQAYLTADRSLIAPTLLAAAEAGARAVVLTVDTPSPGTKHDIDDDAFGDLTGVYGLNHPEAVRGRTPGAEHAKDLGPSDLGWITEITGLPVVAKGVLRPDDALRCLDGGARAVWVSNHGGRQLDRSVTTATALPLVRAAVGDEAEVYVDGGVRSGLDVLAALASGADAVFCGRLPLHALAVDGPDGVTDAFSRVRRELWESLRLAGCPDVIHARSLLEPGACEPR